MRTTVTLDPDTERLLRKAMRSSGKSFKQVLNETLRKGLIGPTGKTLPPFEISPRPMGLRAGFDPVGFHRMLDGDAVDGFLVRQRSRR